MRNMNKYIDAEKLIAILKKLKKHARKNALIARDNNNIPVCALWSGNEYNCTKILDIITSLQQEQPLGGKQVIIITETDGDANIHWDCRSLDDVGTLLASALSFIVDKQVEELRGQGSGPDYDTTEGRFRNAHKFQQEQPEVELEKEISNYLKIHHLYIKDGGRVVFNNDDSPNFMCDIRDLARHFYDLGKNQSNIVNVWKK